MFKACLLGIGLENQNSNSVGQINLQNSSSSSSTIRASLWQSRLLCASFLRL
ncbi:unnamed protein product, partial [Amoebophrya sp. A25]|eukprot:GSA25T00017195001.1